MFAFPYLGCDRLDKAPFRSREFYWLSLCDLLEKLPKGLKVWAETPPS